MSESSESQRSSSQHFRYERSQKYRINGEEYDSLEDIPPHLRKLLEDADGDGIPDFAERLLDQVGQMGAQTSSVRAEMRTSGGVTTYRVGDREYQSLEEMPPEHRELFEDADENGIPDKFESMMGGGIGFSTGVGPSRAPRGDTTSRDVSPSRAIREAGTSSQATSGGLLMVLVLLGCGLVLLLLLAGIAAFLI